MAAEDSPTLEKLGSYDVQAEIGQGGVATVYKAVQPQTGRQVAIKLLRRSSMRDDASLERFRREARLIARLDNPHILPVYDFDGAHDPPYLVMRYVDGGNLAELLAQRLPERREVLRIVRHVADALDYAHRQGVVHRDIKPSNIMLDRDGNAFVTDFGIARMSDSPASTSITRDGTVVGTPDYIAPEQALAEAEVDGRADIYSLGVIVFEMLAGRLPFVADSALSLMMKHLQEPPPSLHALNPRLPQEINDVVGRALAKDPARRFATAGMLAAALQALLKDDRAQAGGAASAPSGQRPAKRAPTPENKIVTAAYLDAADYLEQLKTGAGSFWDEAGAIAARRRGRPATRTEAGLLLVWGADAAGEDDPEQAVRAGLEILAMARARVQAAAADQVPMRIGVHTGLALVNHGGDSPLAASGPSISLTQRLAEAAEGGLLVSPDTYREVRGIFDIQPGEPVRVRGRKDKVNTFAVVGLKSRLIPLGVRGIEGIETDLIGRELELKRLRDAYLNAAEESETQALTIVGDAGLGKSRLLVEFEKWIDLRPEFVTLFRGRATAGLSHRPYALLREVLAFRFEIYDSDPVDVVQAKMEAGVAELLGGEAAEIAHFVGHLAGFDLSRSPFLAGLLNDPKQATTRARQLFLRFFERLATLGPVTIHLDDLQYADDASLDLFDDLLSGHPNLKLLFVGLARPEFLTRRPDWGSGQAAHERLTLAPLNKRDGRDLARELMQKVDDPPRPLRDLLVDRAEGNPLFMEELVKMLIEDRLIVKDSPDVWRVEESRLPSLRVPPTLQGLLQSRFDTLLYPEKLTLQRAAVAGRAFSAAALAALDAADDPGRRVANLAETLAVLTQREFIYLRAASSTAERQEYAFSQTMLRDLIYESLLAGQRATYHAAMANWLAAGERAEERWPAIAEHYELAGQWQQAALCYERAGDNALKLSAFAEALKFYQRAQSPQMPEGADSAPDRPPRARLVLKQGEALYRLADFPAARQAVQSILSSTQAGSLLAAALALAGEIETATGDYSAAETSLATALPLARAGGDKAVLARALYALGDAQWRLGDLTAAEEYLNESILLARETGDTVRTLFALNRLGTVKGSLGQRDEETRLYQEVRSLAEQSGNRDRLMTALNNLGTVAQERGELAPAKNYYRQALDIAREVGLPDSIVLYSANIAYADAKLRNHAAAQAAAQACLRDALRLGTWPWVVLNMITFAELAHARGDDARALALLGLIQGQRAFSRDYRRIMDQSLAEWGLPTETVAEGLARGAALDFMATVEGLAESGQ